MSNNLDKLAHIRVYNCQYSVEQMCTREVTLTQYLGAPYLDDVMSHNEFITYWFAPGAWPHLHVPGVTEGRESVFKAHSVGHPLKCGGT